MTVLCLASPPSCPSPFPVQAGRTALDAARAEDGWHNYHDAGGFNSDGYDNAEDEAEAWYYLVQALVARQLRIAAALEQVRPRVETHLPTWARTHARWGFVSPRPCAHTRARSR